jgi:NAD(P)-dependent dehydrogenase (short-subunit alcohol dehydrogenase family)
MRIRPLNEQVVVVFGASSGIGRETAHRFAKKGAKVVAAARTGEALDSLAEEIRQAGGECHTVVADAADFDQVKAVAEAAYERYGRLDTWAHVAAVAVYAKVMDITPSEFEQVIRVTLLGPVHGAKAAIPYMLRNDGGYGGAFICVTSVEAVRALPYHSSYAAAKHGVHGFLTTLRMEMEHDGLPIRVTEIQPASIDTPFFDKAKTKIGVRPQGAPPVYAPQLVADTIVAAAEQNRRELIVGGAGQGLAIGQRLSPRIMDALMKIVAFEGQKTSIPKGPDDENNLYGPVQGLEQVEGSITGNAFATASRRVTDVTTAASQPLRSNPVVTGVLLGTAALATGLLLARSAARANGERENGDGNGSYPSANGLVGRTVDAQYGPGRPDPLHAGDSPVALSGRDATRTDTLSYDAGV